MFVIHLSDGLRFDPGMLGHTAGQFKLSEASLVMNQLSVRQNTTQPPVYELILLLSIVQTKRTHKITHTLFKLAFICCKHRYLIGYCETPANAVG